MGCLYEEVMSHAENNYDNKNIAWDTVCECYNRQEIEKAIGKAMSVRGAIANVSKYFGLKNYAERRNEMEAEIF
jgi:hypothetical protein